MATEWHDVAAIGLAFMGIGQGAIMFSKARKDRAIAEKRREDLERITAIGVQINIIDTELKVHVKEDREMHERIQKSETKIESQQQQINDVNSRHGDLVTRIDEIHNRMLTKDDLKLLTEFLRK